MGEVGEFELLTRMRQRLAAGGPRLHVGIGDDAAVTVPGGATATSVDAIVEGVHFHRNRASLQQIGHKALATALSDLAAMGAEPGEAYTALGVPRDLDEDGCLELLEGMAGLAEATGATLAGGDVTRAPALSLAVTVVGHAKNAEDLITRSGARAGDQLAVTGRLGGAAAGLLLLERETAEKPADESDLASLIALQLEPQPRLAAGRALAEVGATAMIDISDGLGGDALHLANESRVGIRIEGEALPIAAGIEDVPGAPPPLELAVRGGEDYELLVALPPERLEQAMAAVEGTDTALTRIGEIVPGGGVEIRLPGGELLEPGGFDQLG